MKRSKLFIYVNGKGGIGKSTSARARFQIETTPMPKKVNWIGLDTDIVNPMLSDLHRENAPVYELPIVSEVNGKKKIDESRLNKMITLMKKKDEEGYYNAVMDIGTSNYFVTMNYFMEKKLFKSFRRRGIDTYLNLVIDGGKMLDVTLAEADKIIEEFKVADPDIIFNICLNPYSGDIEAIKPFEQMVFYKKHKEYINEVFRMPEKECNDLLGRSLETGLRFDELIEKYDADDEEFFIADFYRELLESFNPQTVDLK